MDIDMTKEHFNPNRPILRFVGLSFKMRKCVSYHLALQAEAAFPWDKLNESFLHSENESSNSNSDDGDDVDVDDDDVDTDDATDDDIENGHESDEDEKAELNFGIVRKENGQEETEDRQLLERDRTEGVSCGISSAEDEHFGDCFGKGNLPGNDHSVDSPVGDDTLEITRRTELFHLNDR